MVNPNPYLRYNLRCLISVIVLWSLILLVFASAPAYAGNGAISGRVNLEGRQNNYSHSLFTINMTSLSGGVSYNGAQVGHDRSFNINNVIPDTYELIVACPGYLRAGKHVEVTAGQVHDAGLIILLVGDLDGNNVVEIFDLAALAYAYGSVQVDAGFDTVMDFNGDGVIDLFDLILLSRNLNKSGFDIEFDKEFRVISIT